MEINQNVQERGVKKSPKFSVLENFGLCEKLQYAVYKVSSVLFWETLRFLWCLEVYVL